MFVVYVGQRADHRAFVAGRLAGQAQAPRRRSSSRSRSGSGSRCCSPTSPRRWPRAAARRRPTRCAGHAASVHGARLVDAPDRDAPFEVVAATALRKGDLVARRGRRRRSPPTARSIEGIASVDESAITGESAPVIRESGGDRSAVTGGTRVLSDWLVVRVTANPGETFLDRMIALVEGAKRQKTPNEIALNILLAALTIIFLLAMRHAAAVLALQREGRRPGLAGHRSPCWSRCWSA